MRIVVFHHFGRIIAGCVGVARSTIERDVALPVFVAILNSRHLVVFVVVEDLLPAFYLIVAPGHLVFGHKICEALPCGGCHLHVGALLSVACIILLDPCGIEHLARVIHESAGLGLSIEVLREVAIACLPPLRNHHLFNLVGGVHELCCHAVAQAGSHIVFQFEGRRLVVAEESHLAAFAHEQVGAVAYEDIAIRSAIVLSGTGGYLLGSGQRPRLFGR